MTANDETSVRATIRMPSVTPHAASAPSIATSVARRQLRGPRATGPSLAPDEAGSDGCGGGHGLLASNVEDKVSSRNNNLFVHALKPTHRRQGIESGIDSIVTQNKFTFC
jgi:hypothetical protein